MPRRSYQNSAILAVSAFLLAASLTGCARTPPPALHQEQKGLVWILPGIGGGAWCMGGPYRAFRDGGVQGEIRIREWNRPVLDALGHLQKYEQNRALAADIAHDTTAYWDAHPGAPINIVGYSAGGGIALMVAEALPRYVRLRNLILVQAGVSPTWDLAPALERIDGHLVSFYCPTDWLVLGLGTELFGTVDREYVASAGKVGFSLPEAVKDPALRSKFIECRWNSAMLATGHLGQHIGILRYAWNKRYVLPWLLGESPGRAIDAATDPPAETGH